MKKEIESQQGKEESLSSDNKAAKSVHEVAKYTKIHKPYNVLISRKNALSGSPLILLVTNQLLWYIFIKNVQALFLRTNE
jgi:hypothetical protein